MSILAGLDKNAPNRGMTARDRALANVARGSAPATNDFAPPAEITPPVQQKEPEVIPVAPVKLQEPVVEVPATPEAQDPWTPLKSRLGETPLDLWLTEVDATKQERDDFRRRHEIAEVKAKELEERLIEYDVKNDPEYKALVIDPIHKAEEDFLFTLGNDNTLVNEVIKTFQNSSLDQTAKAKAIQAFASEWGVSPLDIKRVYGTWVDAHNNAKNQNQNWEVTKAEKTKQRVLQMEETRKQNEELTRRTYRHAAFKAELKAKELGIPINGYEEAREGYLTTVESALQNKPADVEQEAMYSMLGRMVYNSRGDITEKLQRLQKLEEASRVNPGSAPATEKKTAETPFPKGNPITARRVTP